MLIILLNIQGNCSQRIRPVRPNGQFRILLWRLWRLPGNVQWLRPELWRQRNWLLQHDNAPPLTLPFSQRIVYQKQHGCRPPLSLLSSISPIDHQTVVPPFWHTIEVIEAESQALLITHWTHWTQLPDAFLYCRSAGNCAYALKELTSRVRVASGPKVSFWPYHGKSRKFWIYYLLLC
jgi:hypothetical protein